MNNNNSNNKEELNVEIQEDDNSYDVVVLGGGFGGLIYSIRLQQERPNTKILILEQEKQISYKVGESTLSPVIRMMFKLGLTLEQLECLFENKGGLIYWHTDVDQKIDESIETSIESIEETFQFDRRLLEILLSEMAERYDNIKILRGARVMIHKSNISNFGSTIVYRHQNMNKQVHSKLVCDASGRAALIPRNLYPNEFVQGAPPGHFDCASYWGYFKQTKPIKELPAWQRPNTRHVCFPEGWLWILRVNSFHQSSNEDLKSLACRVLDQKNSNLPLPTRNDICKEMGTPSDIVYSIGFAIRKDRDNSPNATAQEKFYYYVDKYPMLQEIFKHYEPVNGISRSNNIDNKMNMEQQQIRSTKEIRKSFSNSTIKVHRCMSSMDLQNNNNTIISRQEHEIEALASLCQYSKKAAGNGWIAIGDAVGFTNPFWSPGMTFTCSMANVACFASINLLNNQKSYETNENFDLYNKYIAKLQDSLFTEYRLHYLCWNHPRTFERCMVLRNYMAGADTVGKLTMEINEGSDKRNVPVYVPFQKSDAAPLHIFNSTYIKTLKSLNKVLLEGEEEAKILNNNKNSIVPYRFSENICDRIEAIANPILNIVATKPESIGLGKLGPVGAFFPHYSGNFERGNPHFLNNGVVWFVQCDTCDYNIDGSLSNCPVCGHETVLNKNYKKSIPKHAARTKVLPEMLANDNDFGDGVQAFFVENKDTDQSNVVVVDVNDDDDVNDNDDASNNNNSTNIDNHATISNQNSQSDMNNQSKRNNVVVVNDSSGNTTPTMNKRETKGYHYNRPRTPTLVKKFQFPTKLVSNLSNEVESPKHVARRKMPTRITIIYGSETGNSQRFAESLGFDFTQRSSIPIPIRVMTMDDYSMNELQQEELLLIFTSTFGNGSPPHNAMEFYDTLLEKQDTIKLSNLRFGICGLGSSVYFNFCAFAINLMNVLQNMGGELLLPLAKCDANGDQYGEVQKWITAVSKIIKRNVVGHYRRLSISPLASLHTCPLKLTITGIGLPRLGRHCSSFPSSMLLKHCSLLRSYILANGQSSLHSIVNTLENMLRTTMTPEELEEDCDQLCKPIVSRQNPVRVRIISNDELMELETGRSTRRIRFELGNLLSAMNGLSFEPGDHLGVYPTNDIQHVHEVARLLGINNLDAKFKLSHADHSTTSVIRLPFDEEVTFFQALSTYVDLMSAPSRIFIEAASHHARDAEEADQLTQMAEDSTIYEYWVEQTAPTMLSFLTSFISVQMPWVEFFYYATTMQPRLYSISSSLNAHPNEVSITISHVKYDCQNNRSRAGVTSTWLKNCQPTSQWDASFTAPIFIQKSSIRMPKSSHVPIIMIGIGTGIAPYRSFWQERYWLKYNQNQELGEAYLYFGCRRPAEHIYYDEMLDCEEKNILHARVAYSRYEKKQYVTDLMLEDSSELYNLIVNQGAYVYICGDVRIANSARICIQDIIAKQGQVSSNEAQQYVDILTKTSRLQTEIFGAVQKTNTLLKEHKNVAEKIVDKSDLNEYHDSNLLEIPKSVAA